MHDRQAHVVGLGKVRVGEGTAGGHIAMGFPMPFCTDKLKHDIDFTHYAAALFTS